MGDYYDFFLRFLAPGCLRTLTIESWDILQFLSFCTFLLSGAARGLTSISIDTACPTYATLPVYEDAQGGEYLRPGSTPRTLTRLLTGTRMYSQRCTCSQMPRQCSSCSAPPSRNAPTSSTS